MTPLSSRKDSDFDSVSYSSHLGEGKEKKLIFYGETVFVMKKWVLHTTIYSLTRHHVQPQKANWSMRWFLETFSCLCHWRIYLDFSVSF